MKELGVETYCPSDQQEWRNWLEDNHNHKDAVWLIMHKKESSTPNLSWEEAVEVALCFGWIDSTRRPIDSEKFKQYYSKRKAKSIWSRKNKEKVRDLIKDGLITEAGLKSIEIAKQNGSWTIMDTVENLEIPEDLDHEFSKRSESKDYFLSLNNSVRKTMLSWIVYSFLSSYT